MGGGYNHERVSWVRVLKYSRAWEVEMSICNLLQLPAF